MNFRSQTSLIALVFAVSVSHAIAAPTVRSLGGPSVAVGATPTTATAPAPTAPTMPKATGTSSRAGSLRTGGFVTSPTVKTSTSGGGTSGSAQSATTGGSVSSGGGALNSRASSTPRLSTGRYIGAPGKSISSEVPEVDLSGKVDKDQGPNVTGNVLAIGEDGWVTNTEEVYFKEETDELLEKKLDNTADKDLYKGNALVVTETGEILPVGKLLKPEDIDLSGKVDKDQGDDVVGNVLAIDDDGFVTNEKEVYFKEETDELLEKKLDNTADKDLYKGNALVVTETGEILPRDDFVTKYQGRGVSGRALIVDDDGYVTTGRINVDSLGLKHLAYEDTVRNELVDDNTLERAKMAASITDTLEWIDSWREKEPVADRETRYVMAVDEFGQAAWFRVATE